jgi:hypothetical protein
VAHSTGMAYSGDLTRGDERVVACTVSTRATWIQLDSYEP